ncbi:MAG: phytanoyl-CoA dioxygenase family protein [Microthrixaceae bacterium]
MKSSFNSPVNFGIFLPDQLDQAEEFYRVYGFAALRGLLSDPELTAMKQQCETAQEQLTAGDLEERYGTAILIESGAGEKATSLANYVTYVTDLSEAVRAAVQHPVILDLVGRWLPQQHWLLEQQRFGVVYQDARPGRDSSYTRLGWHSDWQSGPNLDIWPAVAFTFHLDATSPANGFLRVVPGSQQWNTPAPFLNVNQAQVPEGSREAAGHSATPPPYEMPLRFEKVAGEFALYCEEGDILFHDAYLWHSAARGTDDNTKRRHIRGSFHSGAERLEGDHLHDFVKNAAR